MLNFTLVRFKDFHLKLNKNIKFKCSKLRTKAFKAMHDVHFISNQF